MLTEFRSLQDVWKKLPTEMDARRFLEDAIWHQGRSCPHCGSFNTGAITGPSARAGLYQCREFNWVLWCNHPPAKTRQRPEQWRSAQLDAI